jgi:hypothetical protein
LLFNKSCVGKHLLKFAHSAKIPFSHDVSALIVMSAWPMAPGIDPNNRPRLAVGIARECPCRSFVEALPMD